MRSPLLCLSSMLLLLPAAAAAALGQAQVAAASAAVLATSLANYSRDSPAACALDVAVVHVLGLVFVARAARGFQRSRGRARALFGACLAAAAAAALAFWSVTCRPDFVVGHVCVHAVSCAGMVSYVLAVQAEAETKLAKG